MAQVFFDQLIDVISFDEGLVDWEVYEIHFFIYVLSHRIEGEKVG